MYRRHRCIKCDFRIPISETSPTLVSNYLYKNQKDCEHEFITETINEITDFTTERKKIKWNRKDLVTGLFPIIEGFIITGREVHRIVEPPQIWVRYTKLKSFDYPTEYAFIVYEDDWLADCVTARLLERNSFLCEEK